MTAKEIVKKLGGVRAVMALTGLSRIRVYQFMQNNHIPKSWLMFFHEKNNDIPLTLTAK